MSSTRNTSKSSKPAVKEAPKAAAKAPKAREVAETSAPKPVAARRKTQSAPESMIEPADRQRFIAEAAYYIAEQRGFGPGGELDDWLLAEAEIDRLLQGAGPAH